MTRVAVHGKRLAEPLNRRRRVTVELPEFALRAIHARVDEANENDADGEEVTFTDVVEWLLVTEVTLRRMPLLENRIPGFTAAMFTWMLNATYSTQDEE
jgi:hypothetical protein